MSKESREESYRLAIRSLEDHLYKEEMKVRPNQAKIDEFKFRINQKREWLEELE